MPKMDGIPASVNAALAEVDAAIDRVDEAIAPFLARPLQATRAEVSRW